MMTSALGPGLRLIRGDLEDPHGWSWFCGHCAARPSTGSVSPNARVCRSCGMGLVLETKCESAPTPHDAFLVVDARLNVQALSWRAEALLGVGERDAIDRPVERFFAAADADGGATADLNIRLAAASAGCDEVHALFVRPLGAFGVRVLARIAPCGPPRAALVVLDAGAARRKLRLV